MKKKEKKQKVYIGGQAVMEGVMMRAPDRMAIAVRRMTDGKIETYTEPIVSLAKKHKILGRRWRARGLHICCRVIPCWSIFWKVSSASRCSLAISPL